MKKCNNNDNWINRTWRPSMGWLYLIICAFDFVIAPTIFIFLQSSSNNIVQWEPLTMKAGGLFHVAMGAIVGVAVWSKGMEKIRNSEFFDKFGKSSEDDDVSKFPSREINVTKELAEKSSIDDELYDEEEDMSIPIDNSNKKKTKRINRTK